MSIYQKSITLKPHRRGFHIITDEILAAVPEIKNIKMGICNIFIKHTSASLTINENADPTVRNDFEKFFDRSVPENPNLYQHTDEGLDDMTSHIKTSILGNSLTIPITNGKLNLGTWQGVYLCEHRNSSRQRSIVITIIGEEK